MSLQTYSIQCRPLVNVVKYSVPFDCAQGKPFEIAFASGGTARAIRIHAHNESATALRAIGLGEARPTLVLVGGASGMSQDDLARLRPL